MNILNRQTKTPHVPFDMIPASFLRYAFCRFTSVSLEHFVAQLRMLISFFFQKSLIVLKKMDFSIIEFGRRSLSNTVRPISNVS